MKVFKALALAGLLACSLAATAMAAPVTIAEEVAAFDKPTDRKSVV